MSTLVVELITQFEYNRILFSEALEENFTTNTIINVSFSATILNYSSHACNLYRYFMIIDAKNIHD